LRKGNKMVSPWGLLFFGMKRKGGNLKRRAKNGFLGMKRRFPRPRFRRPF